MGYKWKHLPTNLFYILLFRWQSRLICIFSSNLLHFCIPAKNNVIGQIWCPRRLGCGCGCRRCWIVVFFSNAMHCFLIFGGTFFITFLYHMHTGCVSQEICLIRKKKPKYFYLLSKQTWKYKHKHSQTKSMQCAEFETNVLDHFLPVSIWQVFLKLI